MPREFDPGHVYHLFPVLTAEEIIGVPGRVSIQYKDLPKTVKPNERILPKYASATGPRMECVCAG